VIDPGSAASFVEALRVGISMLRDALGLGKDVKDALPSSEKKQAMDRGLEQAERQLLLAEAQIAQALGYHFCQCTFPPQIMLSKGYHSYQEVFACPKCGKKWPPPEIPFPEVVADFDPRV